MFPCVHPPPILHTNLAALPHVRILEGEVEGRQKQNQDGGVAVDAARLEAQPTGESVDQPRRDQVPIPGQSVPQRPRPARATQLVQVSIRCKCS